VSDGIDIRIELKENVAEALQRGIAAGLDLTPAMKEIAVHLSASTKLRFETERGPDGKPWKPARRVQESGGQTLTLSGDLRGSIREDWGPDFAAAGPERSGGAAIYAKIHQWGGTIVPKVKKALSFAGKLFARIVMPARPYLGFEPDDPEIIAEIVEDHLGRAFRGAGVPS
jgi:phage virion morphogenesis protein